MGVAVGRLRGVLLAALGAVLVVNGTLLSLAANAATGDSKWPGVLDLLRTRAWWAVGVLTLATIVIAWLVARAEQAPDVEGDPPPPPAPAVEGWLVRREELRQAVDAVLAPGGTTVGLTTSLHGAGGFGKTRLARMVCADRTVRRRFRDRVYLVTLGRDLRSTAEIGAKVGEVTRLITGDTTTFTDPDLAGDHLGRLLEQRPRTLLVLDDVWEREQLDPFLRGAPQCVRLVTTRRPHLLDGRPGSRLVAVDAMTEREARTVLLQDLDTSQLPDDTVAALLAHTGRWPLLLRLVNRLIVAETQLGTDTADAARDAVRRLRQAGPAMADAAGMDAAVPGQRERAVEATVEAAVGLLPPGGPDRLRELGVFAEDDPVPAALVRRFWQSCAGLTGEQANSLLKELSGLSLITVDPTAGGRITLHDVLRDYLRQALGPSGLTRANTHLIAAITSSLPTAAPLAAGAANPRHAWWDTLDGYVLDHAVAHLLAAGRTADAQALAGDLRWIDRRLRQRGPNAPIEDLLQTGSPEAAERAADLRRAAHLLQPTQPGHSLTALLHSRLADIPRWTSQVTAHAEYAVCPRLSNLWPLPDQPQPSLLRTLTGPIGPVLSVAISPDGTWLATAGIDRSVRIWDLITGTETTALTGHTGWVLSVSISPDGSWLATASDDGSVRTWNPAAGTQTTTLTGHSGPVLSVAISPDGTWLATAGNDRSVRIWDPAADTETTTLTGHTRAVDAVAISPDGTWLATASYDGSVRIWDPAAGTETTTLTGHTDSVNAVAISPDGTWLATASSDGSVRIWDPTTGTQTTTLTGHTNVLSVAISPDGTWLATA
ncbi:NB-ARC domain-containing protein, partial [Streptomyces eurythermus]|uniref:NB-ARC domain-containing protein n=1 Tax=Streptomyces eurythermus TaxID=42237 RepID=UPI0036FD0795